MGRGMRVAHALDMRWIPPTVAQWLARLVPALLVLSLPLYLVAGCGSANGDDDDGLTPGAYWTGVDLSTGGCGAEVHEAIGGDVTQHSGNRIRLELNIGDTDGCFAETFTIEGTQTGPTTWDMDNIMGGYLCALDHDFGYQAFDLTGGTIEQQGSDYQLTCNISVDSGMAVCVGSFHVYMEPR